MTGPAAQIPADRLLRLLLTPLYVDTYKLHDERAPRLQAIMVGVNSSRPPFDCRRDKLPPVTFQHSDSRSRAA